MDLYELWHHEGHVRMAERSKALRSGRSLVLQAWVQIPLLTTIFATFLLMYNFIRIKKMYIRKGRRQSVWFPFFL